MFCLSKWVAINDDDMRRVTADRRLITMVPFVQHYTEVCVFKILINRRKTMKLARRSIRIIFLPT